MKDAGTEQLDARGLRVGMAVSRYHDAVTDRLRDGAERVFTDAGGEPDDLVVVTTPGAFELTAVCQALAMRGDLDAVVALGCVIRGETSHDQYIAQAVANGLTQVTLETRLPVAFGLLTCHTRRQAIERAGGAEGNKGEEAMRAAIESVRVIRGIGRRTKAEAQ